MHVMGDQQVGQHRLVFEEFRVLERSGDTQLGGAMRRHVRDLHAVERHAPRLGFVETADQVEDRGLAGPVRPDDAEHFAGVNGEGDITDRLDAAEADGQVARLEQGLAHRTRSVRR